MKVIDRVVFDKPDLSNINPRERSSFLFPKQVAELVASEFSLDVVEFNNIKLASSDLFIGTNARHRSITKLDVVNVDTHSDLYGWMSGEFYAGSWAYFKLLSGKQVHLLFPCSDDSILIGRVPKPYRDNLQVYMPGESNTFRDGKRVTNFRMHVIEDLYSKKATALPDDNTLELKEIQHINALSEWCKRTSPKEVSIDFDFLDYQNLPKAPFAGETVAADMPPIVSQLHIGENDFLAAWLWKVYYDQETPFISKEISAKTLQQIVTV
jgi:hypothetical protein